MQGLITLARMPRPISSPDKTGVAELDGFAVPLGREVGFKLHFRRLGCGGVPAWLALQTLGHLGVASLRL